jgi:hypothetical protein
MWFLAVSGRNGGLDGWLMMSIDDTRRDLLKVAGAREAKFSYNW